MTELQPLFDLLGGKIGWLPTALAWLAALKLASVFFENRATRWASDKLNEIAATESGDDDEYLRLMFSTGKYKLGTFLLRLVGVRLPALADLERAIRLQKEVAAASGDRSRSGVKPRPAGRGDLPPTSGTGAARLNSLLAFAGAVFLFMAAPGCGTLDKAGVYQGDAILYQSELVIVTSYDLIHTFVAWEKENRAALATLPEIRQSADVMRANAKRWLASAHALHDAYAANPTPENRASLETALAVLRAALNEAAGYMSQAATPP